MYNKFCCYALLFTTAKKQNALEAWAQRSFFISVFISKTTTKAKLIQAKIMFVYFKFKLFLYIFFNVKILTQVSFACVYVLLSSILNCVDYISILVHIFVPAMP